MKYRVKSIDYRELDVILCDDCFERDWSLQDDPDVMICESIGDCVISNGTTDIDRVN